MIRKHYPAGMILVFILMIALSVTTAFAALVPFGKDVVMENDDGNGTSFKKLETNYVQLGTFDLSKAEILSGGGSYRIVRTDIGSYDVRSRHYLAYVGKMKFGGARRTNTAHAVTKGNDLPDVTIQIPDVATLSDGRQADIRITFSDVHVELTQTYPVNGTSAGITDNTTVYQYLCSTNDGVESAKLSLCATPPRKNTTSRAANSNAGVGIRYKITASIIDKATDAPVSADDYPSMVILFKDIDAADYLNKYASISSNTAAEVEARYNGDYAEHVELAENWFDPVVLAKNSSDPINTSLLKYFVRGNNMFIRGDGRKYYATGSVNDGNTLYSGFAASVPPSGFSFYWGASTNGNSTVADNYYTENIATNFGLQPTVAVWAKRSPGGTLTNSGQDEWQKNTHLMNSRGIYEYRPEEGYEVSSLKVDGEEQPLTDEQKNEGGTYVFERLNVDPVSLRYRSGDNILESGTSGHYEIEVTFVKKPDPSSLTVTKNVTGSLGDITKRFAFAVTIKGLPAGFEGRIENSGAITDLGFDGNTFEADASGAATLKFRLKDDASIKFTDLPAGAKFEVTEAESDHDPSYVLRREDTVIRSERLDMHGALSTGEIRIGEGEDITAEFTNYREIAPNTGSAHGGSNEPIAASVALLALMALMLSWKLRRNRAE